MNDLTLTSLTQEEEKFLYNLEVLGLPQQRAADMAGVGNPSALLKKPEVANARETLRAATRARVNITKDDVIRGYLDAVQDAKLLGDPMAQIAGWREISKSLGYDAPREVKITINGTAKEVRKQVAQLTDNDLVDLLGADSVIDGDFYVVKEHESKH